MKELQEREQAEFGRKCRIIVQERLDANMPVTVEIVLDDLEKMERLKVVETRGSKT